MYFLTPLLCFEFWHNSFFIVYDLVLGVYGVRATGRKVGFVLGVLSYPRISSSVPRSAIPARLSPLLAVDRRLLGL